MTDKNLEDKIREFDALFDEEPTSDEDEASARVATRNPSVPPVDAPPKGDTSAPVMQVDESVSSPDVVRAMQQLLLKHEDTQLNRVEDPDLARVLAELRNLAHSNIADLFECEEVMEYIGADNDDEGIYKNATRLKVRDITKLPREITACIQSIKVTNKPDGDVVEIKMYDKQVSLDKLMRFHGAYMRDNEQNSNKTQGVMDLLLSSIGSQGMPTIANNDA